MKVEQVSFRNTETGMDWLFPVDESFEYLPRVGEEVSLLSESEETTVLDGIVEKVSWIFGGNTCSIIICIKPQSI